MYVIEVAEKEFRHRNSPHSNVFRSILYHVPTDALAWFLTRTER